MGGIICPEIREENNRVGFSVVDLRGGRRGTLAHIGLDSGPRIGKYRINLRDLSEVGVTAIRGALAESDLVVIDEVGPMELQGSDFREAVEEALASPKPVLGVVHWRASHPLVNRIRSEAEVYEVTAQNRERIQAEILEKLLEALEERQQASR